MVKVTMLFNSYEFILAFLPVFLIGFYVIRHIYRGKEILVKCCNLWIVAGSLYFYALFGIRNLLVLTLSILWNASVIKVLSTRRKNASLKDCGKAWMFLGVLVDICLLLFFKFGGVFFPIAISFYTFNQISYIVDYYRGEIDEFDPVTYLAYILFFPKILQGPLMDYGDYIYQQKKSLEQYLDWEKVMRGILLISLGSFKKVILADTIGAAVDYGYNNLANLGWIEAVLTAVFYSFQLYFDFSGYCDVAGGICMMMGFELSDNFNSPYKAVNIMDFWNRWHISLTRFFTKYVYIPLGGSRKGVVRTYVNIMIVFLVSGLWHGSGWTFIIWGAMHGILSVVTRALRDAFVKASDAGHNNIASMLKDAVRVVFTFVYVTIAWVFFRAATISDAVLLFKRMFSGGIRPYYSDFADFFRLDEIWYVLKLTPVVKYNFSWDLCMWLFLAASIIIVFFCKNAISFSGSCKIGVPTTILTVILLLWSVLSFGGVSTFLYMNF